MNKNLKESRTEGNNFKHILALQLSYFYIYFVKKKKNY